LLKAGATTLAAGLTASSAGCLAAISPPGQRVQYGRVDTPPLGDPHLPRVAPGARRPEAAGSHESVRDPTPERISVTPVDNSGVCADTSAIASQAWLAIAFRGSRVDVSDRLASVLTVELFSDGQVWSRDHDQRHVRGRDHDQAYVHRGGVHGVAGVRDGGGRDAS